MKQYTFLAALLILAGGRASRTQSAPAAAPVAEHLTFDAVSIKPSDGANDSRMFIQIQPGGRIVTTNTPLRTLIILAYQLPLGADRAMIGAPSWIDSKRYNVEAKAESNPTHEQLFSMLQSLLADRFKLTAHWETRQLPIYALVLSKNGKTGAQLVPHAADNSTCRDLAAKPMTPPQPGGPPFVPPVPCGGGFLIGPGRIGTESTMEQLAKNLSWFQQIDRAVVDKTGLSGTFDMNISYVPFVSAAQPGNDASTTDSSSPSTIFTALQEQLGLKLEPTTGPVNIFVIDHIEEPSPN